MKIFMLALLMLTPLAQTAQVSSVNQNGTFWSHSMSSQEKVMYVWGFRDGYDHGYFNGRGDVYLKETVGKGRTPLTDREVYEAMHPSVSLSNGDIIQQVDRFYADYRNVPVCMDDAVLQAIDSLKGRAWTDADLALYRRSKNCSIN